MRVSGSCLSPKEIQNLHKATLKVLSRTGVRFAHGQALEIFKKSGAKIEGDKVFIDQKLLERALESTPKSFTLYGRESRDHVVVGGGRPVYAPASGPVFVKRGSQKRPASRQDFIDLMKLTQDSPVLGVANYIVVEPQDIAGSRRRLFQVAAALKYSTKPLAGMNVGEGETRECFKLVRDFYGGLSENRLLGFISPISPLTYDRGMIERIMEYAHAGQPLLFASCSQPGFSSPATLAGTVVVDNAQQLAGIVFSQLCKPGLPVIYGSTSVSCDMRYAAPAIGSPEAALMAMATAALAKYYGLPCRTGGTLTDAKLPDMQAGLESMMLMLSTMISGADFILHSCGIIDSFNTVSFEKFIIDEATVAVAERFVAGFDVDEQKLAVEVIERVGPGGMYLDEEHTALHYRSELSIPPLLSRESYSSWEQGGSRTLEQQAQEILNGRLQDYEPPPLTPEQENILAQHLY